MSEKSETCFDAKHLSRFLHEQLDESEESSVVEHLNNCASCQTTLESIAADGSLWCELREYYSDRKNDSSRPSAFSSEDEVKHLVELLGPTDYPDMMGRIGTYEVSGVVGRGSTGLVLKAFEQRLNRYVAIKVLSPNFASSGSARARFEREARAVAAVAHEHVVPVFAVDEYRNVPYLVMQYVGGGSLQQRIDRQGPLEVCEVVRVGMQVASGLAAAHAQGIVHRDVKPANVMLESGVERAMVTDFGLARVIDEASMTRSGIITGTPQFMSPEQAKGDYIDHRSDLFSLGSLMYTACTGRPPFRSETVYGVIRRVCESKIRPIREINPTAPEWLETFIARLCSKDREDRFESAKIVRETLAQELAHLQSPTAINVPDRSWELTLQKKSIAKKPTRSRLLFGCCASVILALAFSLVIKSRERASDAPQTSTSTTDDTRSDANLVQTDLANFVFNPNNQPVFASTITRAFPVESEKRLTLLAGRGHVSLFPSGSEQLEIRVKRTVAASNRNEAKEHFAKHRLVFTADDHGFTAHSHVSEQEANRFDDFEFQVFLPERYGVDISTLGGNISAEAIGGEMIASTRGGSVDVAEIDGHLRLTTDGGIVSVGSVHGNATIESIEGHIHLAHVQGDVFTRTTIGDTILDKIEGSADIKTSSGNVEVTFAAQPERASSIETIGGNISMSLRNGLAFDLEAETVGGFVRTPFVKSKEPMKKLTSPFNGGGVALRATSVSGRITVLDSGFRAPLPGQSRPKSKEYHDKW